MFPVIEPPIRRYAKLHETNALSILKLREFDYSLARLIDRESKLLTI